jgi:tetratricopeptide (TPR) repeat protein
MVALLHPCPSPAQTPEQWVAKVVSVQGTVQAKRANETQWQPVKLNDTFGAGDTIRVLDRSRADLALANRPLLRLDQGTTITLKGVKEEKTSIVELIKGAAHFFSRVTRGLEVETGFVNAGIEGTEFFMRVEEDKTFLSIFEGKVLASNAAGSLILTSGQSAIAEAGKAPVLRVVVRPRDAVQWALYYPPVIYVRPGEPEPKEDMGDPRYLAHRASLLLAVGRVDEANADIGKALNLAPNNSDALALQSVIALVQNDKGKALDLGKKSVEADPKSASARIALSYAQQANFNLEGARDTLKEAVKSNPENALAWARLAEIWLSFAELGKALDAAHKAVSLNPDLSRTQTVLGFAYLTQVKTGKATSAFQRAIELDQADPLPRLGLGLAKIRDGGWSKWEKDLVKMVDSGLMEGARDLEIAASLDPDNSLIRSYLGKAYYEKTDGKLATSQFDMAKKLDPKDPTPYFYDAIEKQTTNRPVEALQDFEKAIELNDNRAVYRSKLLLDSDLAARSASVARIYSDLAFQQRALVEGWNSVNTDPSDFSGHRFLADTYAALPRHEIARVSELLQSQLLQPLNMTPIQPRLGESNLFLLSGQGPASLSFNEFNPLFTRNGVTFQGGVFGGENATFGGEGIVSGIYKRLSFSVGYNYFETDGWRHNADQKDQIANAFLQYELFPQTSIQGEYRYRLTKDGDLQQRFFTDDFFPNLRQEDETNSIRLGLHQGLWPGSELLWNLMFQKAERIWRDSPDPILRRVDLNGDDRAFSSEIQHLFSSKYIKTITGVGFFKIDSQDYNYSELYFPPDFFFPGSSEVLFPDYFYIPRDVRHTDLYLYSYINFPKNVTFTIGASGDFVRQQQPDRHHKDTNKFNPKFGITWNPFQGTTLRGAAFRVLKRTLITDQTLEPTQVAGFNQFFDDWNYTQSSRYGIGVDQKLFRSLFGGVEYSYRDLDVPYTLNTVPAQIRTVDWSENLARAYLYWTPHKWFGLTAEYMYEGVKRDIEFALGAKRVSTNRVPLGINFYHPSGLSAMLKGTYVYQKGSFERQSPTANGVYIDGDDHFWLFDAAINYRLPKRYGFITVGVRNLFDQKFKYYDTDWQNPAIQPDRFFYGKITLALP